MTVHSRIAERNGITEEDQIVTGRVVLGQSHWRTLVFAWLACRAYVIQGRTRWDLVPCEAWTSQEGNWGG